ncbi:MAG TPA: pentapeptide repeat-containing protein, partial [Cyclobacteriaceae bacterium]
IDCEFRDCNLSMAKLRSTSLKEVKFKDCKLIGLRFDECQEFLFAVNFENCALNLSSFYRRKMKGTRFRNSTLHEVDFTEADISQSLLENCDLNGAIFDNTILEKADFRTAFNYSIAPDSNYIKKARFSVDGIAGLLDKYNIDIS